MRILSYRRWRHTHGYGVHSPFAYRVVCDAVRPSRGYAYYGDHDIECALLENGIRDRHAEHLARLALRLCDIVRPEAVFISQAFPRAEAIALEAAVRAAGSAIAIRHSLKEARNCGLVISYGESAAAVLGECAAGPGTTLLLDFVSEGFLHTLFSHVGEGLLLEGVSSGIIFNRRGMTRTEYTLFL